MALTLVVIIILSIFYINRQRLNKTQRDSLVLDAQKLNKELKRDIIKDSSFIKLIDNLFGLEECSPSTSEGDTYLRKKFRSILNDLKSEESLNDIEILADYYNDNLIKKLRDQVHNLSAKQISYICLFKLGFSNTSICCILNIRNLNALHQLRSRIKNNIENSHTSEKELFISALKINK